ncbi:MAG: tRNA glutamyl-Q(34) synthetase GluQRS [Polyangiaceae bacterium]|nr:tRNA glutamyl-Q(34) synthetase GluQRS [Polyangiaceae bacterium]
MTARGPEARRASPVVGRLAPSPTGLLHLGHARTFLCAFWSARAAGGRVLLRLEDLDGPRVRPGMIDAALCDLAWLGLEWDEAPLVQSEGLPRLRAAVAELVRRGAAYPCVCSRADVRRALSAPQAGEAEPRYPGTCRERFPSLEAAERRAGRAAGLRFRVPDGEVEIRDAFAAPTRHDVARETGDFVVSKRDHTPAYQLAVVVDDAFQGVTEVLRGDDLLPSTARQWHLQRALGLPHPRWIHLPLVVDDAGRRFAKRADDLSLAELRARGVDPRAVVAWAARASGMIVPERVAAAEASAAFALEAVPRTPVRCDGQTLARLLAARA